MAALYNKYRPRTLDRLIGHERAVARLQGIIKKGVFPGSLLITGPTSAGKTTLARAFANTLYGTKSTEGNPDYKEINAANARGIDEVREMLAFSKYKPRGKKRIIVLDEAQQFTGPSMQLLLKPLEDPPPSTLFIVCSMEPEKLHPALRGRQNAIRLQAPSKPDIAKFARRIIKGEEMAYVPDSIVTKLVEFSDGQYRLAANQLEGIKNWMDGLQEPPKKIKESDLEEALESSEDNDSLIAVAVMASVYSRKFEPMHKALLDVVEPFTFMNKLVNLNTFLLNSMVMKGEKHPSIWFSRDNIAIKAAWDKIVKIEDPAHKLAVLGTTQSALMAMKTSAFNFMIQEKLLISSHLFELIQRLRVLNTQYAKRKE